MSPWTRPPASSVPGTSQARILEWVAISISKGSSWPWDPCHLHWQANSLPLSHQGSLNPFLRELSFGTLPFRNALLYSLEAYIQSQLLSIWHYSHLSVVHLEMKSGMCYDHVNSQTGHKEVWQLVGEALGWFVVLLLSCLVVIINNKLPKHNEVVTDNRKSIMHENIPVIYWYWAIPTL